MTVRISLVATRSLIPTGTPASGPGSSPAAILASTAAAAVRATSGVGVQNAWMYGSRVSMRRRTASVTSTAESVLSLTRSATVTASMRQISLSALMGFLLLVRERSGRRQDGPDQRREAAAWCWRKERCSWDNGRKSGTRSGPGRWGSSDYRRGVAALLPVARDLGSRQPGPAN